MLRVEHPSSGSTLITSAPMSAKILPHKAPFSSVRSSIRKPFKSSEPIDRDSSDWPIFVQVRHPLRRKITRRAGFGAPHNYISAHRKPSTLVRWQNGAHPNRTPYAADGCGANVIYAANARGLTVLPVASLPAPLRSQS